MGRTAVGRAGAGAGARTKEVNTNKTRVRARPASARPAKPVGANRAGVGAETTGALNSGRVGASALAVAAKRQLQLGGSGGGSGGGSASKIGARRPSSAGAAGSRDSASAGATKAGADAGPRAAASSPVGKYKQKPTSHVKLSGSGAAAGSGVGVQTAGGGSCGAAVVSTEAWGLPREKCERFAAAGEAAAATAPVADDMLMTDFDEPHSPARSPSQQESARQQHQQQHTASGEGGREGGWGASLSIRSPPSSPGPSPTLAAASPTAGDAGSTHLTTTESILRACAELHARGRTAELAHVLSNFITPHEVAAAEADGRAAAAAFAGAARPVPPSLELGHTVVVGRRRAPLISDAPMDPRRTMISKRVCHRTLSAC